MVGEMSIPTTSWPRSTSLLKSPLGDLADDRAFAGRGAIGGEFVAARRGAHTGFFVA